MRRGRAGLRLLGPRPCARRGGTGRRRPSTGRPSEAGEERAYLGLVRLFLDTVEPARAKPFLEEALRRFPGLARPLLAENLLNEGRAGEAEALGFSGPRLFLRQGRPAEALELLKRAEDPGLHRPPQNHREGSLLRALLECVAGDAEEGLRFAERGRFEAEALGSPFGLSLAEARKGHALLALGRLREAEASYRAALALSEGGPARLGVEALGGLAALGDDGAYREMVRLSRASGDLWVEGFLTLVVALARLRLGEEFPLGAFPAPDPFIGPWPGPTPSGTGGRRCLSATPSLRGGPSSPRPSPGSGGPFGGSGAFPCPTTRGCGWRSGPWAGLRCGWRAGPSASGGRRRGSSSPSSP